MIAHLKIEVLPKKEISDWISRLHKEKPSMALGVLLAGDRITCVNQVIVAKIEDKIVGIATISERGEMYNGKPSIVALYVIKNYRKQGIGAKLIEFAIDYMIGKDLLPIHMEVMNSKILTMIEKLPNEKKNKLKISNQSMGEVMDYMLEA